MIARSIEVALKSACFDHVIVSTDDAEIREVSKVYGAQIPFMRPTSLSDDHKGTSPVIAHAIEWYRDQGIEPDFVCCIYATAPFITSVDLIRGLNIIRETGAEFAFTVTSYAFPIHRAIRLTMEERIEMFQPAYFESRSQDLEEAFHDAGQFYWGTSTAWCSGKPIFGRKTVPIVILPRYRVQDIDTEEDWEKAQRMARSMMTP